MQQWINDALLTLSSTLFLDQLVNFVNQTRLFAANDIFLKRKPSYTNRLCLTLYEDALADELVSMTKQTYMSRHDPPINNDQLYLLKRRLRQAKRREDVALLRTRAWRERREFLDREQDKLDKEFQEHRKSIENEKASKRDNHLKSLMQELEAAQKAKQGLVAEVASLQEESRQLKKSSKARPKQTSQGNLNLLKKATSEEARRCKAKMEKTSRLLEAIKASHSRFMVRQSQTHRELRALTSDLHAHAKQVKLICSKHAKLNHSAEVRLESLRQETARLREDLVPNQEVSETEERCSKLRKYLKGMGAILLMEGIACLTFFMM